MSRVFLYDQLRTWTKYSIQLHMMTDSDDKCIKNDQCSEPSMVLQDLKVLPPPLSGKRAVIPNPSCSEDYIEPSTSHGSLRRVFHSSILFFKLQGFFPKKVTIFLRLCAQDLIFGFGFELCSESLPRLMPFLKVLSFLFSKDSG